MPSAAHRRWRRPPMWAAGLVIFGATFAAYWPSIYGGVLWDDPAHLTIPALRTWAGFWRILTQVGTTQEYYPVLHGAFWIEHRLWGDYLPAYHVLNIVLHAGSACLLALMLRRMWRHEPDGGPGPGTSVQIPEAAAWFAGLLFALHPVAVESVAWITEQKNTLSVFLDLLSALVYLRFDENRRHRDYGLAFIVFVFAVGAKTATLTLPAALLVVIWWRRSAVAWRRDVVPLLPWFVLSLAAGLVTVKVETTFVGAEGAAYALTWGERVMLAPRIVWFYLTKDVWPHDLLFYYPRWNVPAQAASWWAYAAATIAVTAGLWLLRRKFRGPLAGWLLFLGVMFPVIGFFNVFAFIFSYVADHFQYMPCFVAVATATGMVARATATLPARVRIGVGMLALGLAAGFAVETHELSALYLSNETLFRHVIARNPDAWMAHQILGTTYAQSGRGDAAIAQYREVLRLKPDHPNAYHGLALEIGKKPGGRAESLALYAKAIELRPQYCDAHYNLGVALAQDPAHRTEAIEHLKVAVGLQPYFVQAQLALGNLLALDPATVAEALSHFETALRYSPQDATAHRDYADALARGHRLADAVGEYETALRLDPNDARAHFHLADVLASRPGAEAQAMAQYQAALRLDPGLAEAQAHLAGVLSRDPRRLTEAISHAQAAVALNPADPETHNLLGILYVQQGQVEPARREWEAALRLDPHYADPRQNLARLEQLLRRQGTR